MADNMTTAARNCFPPPERPIRSLFFFTGHGLSGIGHHLSGQLYEPLKVHEAYQPIPR